MLNFIWKDWWVKNSVLRFGHKPAGDVSNGDDTAVVIKDDVEEEAKIANCDTGLDDEDIEENNSISNSGLIVIIILKLQCQCLRY